MFDITFLGTSASAPSIQRGLSSQVVSYRDHRFMIDCGEGTQRQILKSGLGFRRLNKILLTHAHLDHILGLGGLVSTFARWEATDRLDIWGGRATLERVHDLIFGVVLKGAETEFDIILHEVTGGTIFEDENLCVSAFPVKHRGPDCYGYTFEEKERRPFLNEKATELGVPQGPERRDLVNGKPVILGDGRIVSPDEVLGERIPGIKICITGDSSYSDRMMAAIKGADVLISEGTYIDEEKDMARRFGHMTVRQAAEMAQKAGVQVLILTHVSRRYRERDLLSEAQAVFPESHIARDFDQFHVRRGAPITKTTVAAME